MFSKKIKLPEPKYESNTSIEKALLKRRSVRSYVDEPLTLPEISQLFWAVQGTTDPAGFRTAPSAGALYPLEVYLVAGKVTDLDTDIYKYQSQGHQLTKIVDGDKRNELGQAAFDQGCIKNAPAVIVISAIYDRTTGKYGRRGIRYVHFEVGYACQNIYLQAASLNLGTVIIGAFDDGEVKKVLNMEDNEQPLAIMPVGKI